MMGRCAGRSRSNSSPFRSAAGRCSSPTSRTSAAKSTGPRSILIMAASARASSTRSWISSSAEWIAARVRRTLSCWRAASGPRMPSSSSSRCPSAAPSGFFTSWLKPRISRARLSVTRSSSSRRASVSCSRWSRRKASAARCAKVAARSVSFSEKRSPARTRTSVPMGSPAFWSGSTSAEHRSHAAPTLRRSDDPSCSRSVTLTGAPSRSARSAHDPASGARAPSGGVSVPRTAITSISCALSVMRSTNAPSAPTATRAPSAIVWITSSMAPLAATATVA